LELVQDPTDIKNIHSKICFEEFVDMHMEGGINHHHPKMLGHFGTTQKEEEEIKTLFPAYVSRGI